MLLFGSAYAAPNKGTTILYWFRSPKTLLYPLEMVKFKDFSRPLCVFQVLFKANLIFKIFSRQSCIFKYFSSLCEPCAKRSKTNTRARSRWGAIANQAKGFLLPSTPKSHPWAWRWQQNENSVQYVFYLLFVRTHTKFGMKIFEIDMLMIFDLLTSPKGHQFDSRMKMLLAFCSSCHSRRFNMLHN